MLLLEKNMEYSSESDWVSLSVDLAKALMYEI